MTTQTSATWRPAAFLCHRFLTLWIFLARWASAWGTGLLRAAGRHPTSTSSRWARLQSRCHRLILMMYRRWQSEYEELPNFSATGGCWPVFSPNWIIGPILMFFPGDYFSCGNYPDYMVG